MARFYGYLPHEIESLDIETFNDLWLAITTIEAQEQLLAIQAAGFVYMKESNKKKIEKDLNKHAQVSGDDENKKEVTMRDLGKILASAGG